MHEHHDASDTNTSNSTPSLTHENMGWQHQQSTARHESLNMHNPQGYENGAANTYHSEDLVMSNPDGNYSAPPQQPLHQSPVPAMGLGRNLTEKEHRDASETKSSIAAPNFVRESMGWPYLPKSTNAASSERIITYDPRQSYGGAASAYPSQMGDATPFSLDTRPSQLTLDSVRKAKGIQNYESVVHIDGKWTEIWCGKCGRNAIIDNATKIPRFFGGAIGLVSHLRSHFKEEKELQRLVPVFEHIKRRHVSDEDVALMKAGKEPMVAIIKRTVDTTKATTAKTTPKKRTIDMPQYGTSVSPRSSVDMPSPCKKLMFEPIRKDYDQQQRERDDEEPLPEDKPSGA